VTNPDGTVGWQLTSKIPLRDEDGHVTGLVGIGRNITMRKEVQRELEASEKLLRDLVENQGEGIGITDLNNEFIFTNPAAEQIFGMENGGLKGLSVFEFIADEDVERIKAETDLRKAGKKSSYELEIIRPDGETRTILLTVTPRLDMSGKVIGSFAIFRDFTEQRRVLDHVAEDAKKAGGSLKGLIPICAWCNKIRDDEKPGAPWLPPSTYIGERIPDAEFTHGLCGDCQEKIYPEMLKDLNTGT